MGTAIETLAVSEKWKSKFQMLEKIGADEHFIYKAMSSPEFKALKPLEKLKISFNILALIFGPFYYFAKKMWLKGAVLLGGMWAFNGFLTVIEIVTGMTIPAVIFWVPGVVIYSQLANYDFYRKTVHGEDMWSGLSVFSKTVPAVGLVVASFVFVLTTLFFRVESVPECDSQSAHDLVLQIARDEFIKQTGEKVSDQFALSVSAMRVTGINKITDGFRCKANLDIVHIPSSSEDIIPITYTVEKTDGGKNVYVEVFGL